MTRSDGSATGMTHVGQEQCTLRATRLVPDAVTGAQPGGDHLPVLRVTVWQRHAFATGVLVGSAIVAHVTGVCLGACTMAR